MFYIIEDIKTYKNILFYFFWTFEDTLLEFLHYISIECSFIGFPLSRKFIVESCIDIVQMVPNFKEFSVNTKISFYVFMKESI